MNISDEMLDLLGKKFVDYKVLELEGFTFEEYVNTYLKERKVELN